MNDSNVQYMLDRAVEDLLRITQTMTFAIEQGTVAIAVPALIAPVITAADRASKLAAQLPAATFVRGERNLSHTAYLDGIGVMTDLTVEKMFPEERQ